MKYIKTYEALDTIKLSDMKSRWGMDPKVDKEILTSKVDDIRDRFLSFEDSGVVSKYHVGIAITFEEEVGDGIMPGDDNIQEAIDDLYELVLNSTPSHTGIFEDKVMVSVNINLPSERKDRLEGYFLSSEEYLMELLELKNTFEEDGYEYNIQFLDKRAGRIPISIVILFEL